MRKLLLCICFISLALSGIQGWSQESSIEGKIVALDKIKPEAFKYIKPLGCSYVIEVRNQEQFDGINDAITKAVADGTKNIRVRIANGVYQFHENHIQRKGEQKEDVSISIEGNEVAPSGVTFFVFTVSGILRIMVLDTQHKPP